MKITDAQLAQFHREGYFVLESVVPEDQFELASRFGVFGVSAQTVSECVGGTG